MYKTANFYLTFPASACLRETEKAKCYHLNSVDIWLPKSQIIHDATDGENINLTIPYWLVLAKGLEIYADQEWLDLGCPE